MTSRVLVELKPFLEGAWTCCKAPVVVEVAIVAGSDLDYRAVTLP